MQQANMLQSFDLVSVLDKIYFSHICEPRTRLNLTTNFGFQGAPVVRALLNFALKEATVLHLDDQKLLGFFFLYGASVWGYDKVIDPIVQYVKNCS